jgi:hypothetical protein
MLLVPAGSSEINDLAQLLDCVADVLWCTVCACMQTQAKQVRWVVLSCWKAYSHTAYCVPAHAGPA